MNAYKNKVKANLESSQIKNWMRPKAKWKQIWNHLTKLWIRPKANWKKSWNHPRLKTWMRPDPP
jgi:hypothetical protein